MSTLSDALAEVILKMRQDSRESIAMFVEAAEADMGGVLVIQAPSKKAKRALPEAGYRTEGFPGIVGAG